MNGFSVREGSMIFRTAFLAAAWPFLAAAWPFLAAAWPNGLRNAQPRVNAAAAEDVILHPPPNPPQCRLHELRSVDRAFSHFSLPSLAALQSCSPAVLQPCGWQSCSLQPCSLSACSPVALQPCGHAAARPCSLQPRPCNLAAQRALGACQTHGHEPILWPRTQASLHMFMCTQNPLSTHGPTFN